MNSLPPNTSQNRTTLDYLGRLATSEYWGSITLKFERGVVVHIRKEESLKPTELSGNPRSHSSDPRF